MRWSAGVWGPRGTDSVQLKVKVKSLLKFCCVCLCLVGLGPSALHAEDAREMVRRAVQSEMKASRLDQSRWRFRDDERDKRTVSIVVQTDAGTVKRLVMRDGKPLNFDQALAEDDRIQYAIHDAARLAKQRKDGAADDKSASELLQMLPEAFAWKVAGDNEQDIAFAFAPNPSFHPPDMQSKVMGAMAGELVVDKRQQRIKTIRGRLTEDVMLGFGILGRMKQGGTFDVERREVKPGMWQITETHVHMDGKALFFKTIGQQQDEIQTEFEEVPGNTTLEQAAAMSKNVK